MYVVWINGFIYPLYPDAFARSSLMMWTMSRILLPTRSLTRLHAAREGGNGSTVTTPSDGLIQNFDYFSHDGHSQKATIEHVFRVAVDDESEPMEPSSSQQPWSMGWQMSERNTVWTNELKLRLIKVMVLFG